MARWSPDRRARRCLKTSSAGIFTELGLASRERTSATWASVNRSPLLSCVSISATTCTRSACRSGGQVRTRFRTSFTCSCVMCKIYRFFGRFQTPWNSAPLPRIPTATGSNILSYGALCFCFARSRQTAGEIEDDHPYDKVSQSPHRVSSCAPKAWRGGAGRYGLERCRKSKIVNRVLTSLSLW